MDERDDLITCLQKTNQQKMMNEIIQNLLHGCSVNSHVENELV